MTTGTVDGPEGTWPLQVSITPGGSTGIEVESLGSGGGEVTAQIFWEGWGVRQTQMSVTGWAN